MTSKQLKKDFQKLYLQHVNSSKEHFEELKEIKKSGTKKFEEIKLSFLMAKSHYKLSIYIHNFDIMNAMKEYENLKTFQDEVLDELMFGNNITTVKIVADDLTNINDTYLSGRCDENARRVGNTFLDDRKQFEYSIEIITNLM